MAEDRPRKVNRTLHYGGHKERPWPAREDLSSDEVADRWLWSTPAVRLGAMTCPSGELVLIDAECLGHWSGSGIPLDLDAQWVDAEIIGPDAIAAAQAFHRQTATILYDIPRHAQDRYTGLFATMAGGLDATLRILEMGDSFFPTQLELDATGAPCALTLTVDVSSAEGLSTL